MSIFELLMLSVGLAMDAFAVSICKGISMKKMKWNKALIIGLWFGIFQALMPLIGYLFGSSFRSVVLSIDHWIAFVLLLLIGLNMIKDSFSKEDSKNDDNVNFKIMFILALATSIDALSVGITFAFFNVNIIISILLIGIITFIISVLGTKIGNRFGDKYKKKSQIFGGLVLILLGLKILLEHLNFL